MSAPTDANKGKKRGLEGQENGDSKKQKKNRKVPVTVLTGFLGAGKTTLLNHILKDMNHKLKFAIIENEFGEIGVDEKIVANQEKIEEQIVEVMNGCICCTVRGDLVKALKRMYEKISQFDAVIIETTGLADPAPVAQTFFVDEDIEKLYYLDGVITVVDAKHVCDHLDEVKPEGVENEAQEQLAFADRVLLNKCDLFKKEPDGEKKLDAIEKRIKSINTYAKVYRCEYSKVDPQHLLNLNSFSLDRVLEFDPEFLEQDPGDHKHDDSVTSVAYEFEGELNINKLRWFINKLTGTPQRANDLFRYKGVIAVKGSDKKYIFQGVHMLFAADFSNEQLWKEGEVRKSCFVFIGKNLDKMSLKAGFDACKVTQPLRFKVGDVVEANTNAGWQIAKVLQCWDAGSPYRMELQNVARSTIWAPVDEPGVVREFIEYAYYDGRCETR